MRQKEEHPFEFEGAAVRVVKIDGEPWFVAVDVCRALGYNRRADGTVNTSQALKHLGAKEVTAYPIGGFRGVPPKLISEAGMYRLVMRSDKPAARRFQDWVTGTVLPAIRKDGAYIMGEEKVVHSLHPLDVGATRHPWRLVGHRCYQ